MNQWGTCVKPFSDANVSDGGTCDSYLDAMNTANDEITARTGIIYIESHG